jgi:hypothetical protein
MQNIIKKLNVLSDYSYVAFAISVVAIALTTFIGPMVLLPFSVLLFSSMDAIGYFHLVWGGDQSVPANNQEARLVSYRFIQVGFQTLVSSVLYFNMGFIGVVSFNILWWFGLCDMLYYVLLKQRFIDYDDMFWLWWTPAGILQKIGVISKVTGVTMLIQSIIGILITILVMSL